MRASPCRRCAASSTLARGAVAAIAILCGAAAAQAQTITQRGFVEGTGFLFPREARTDPVNTVGDLLVREEIFVKPADWVQFAAGADVRANSYDQVEDDWSGVYWDRTVRRPRLSVRRLAMTLSRGPFTVDLGKQFVRWGTTDIVNPTDRFAPRDFINVVEPEFLGITAARAVAQAGRHTIDVVFTPRLTPSRTPLPDQRWAVVPASAEGLPVQPVAPVRPDGAQGGVRWTYAADALQVSLSVFDGYNHLPNVVSEVLPAQEPPFQPAALAVTTTHPSIRTWGGDMSLPLRWLTLKAEAAYFTSDSPLSDEYTLYVLQLERQSGEWVFVGGYAGEAVSRRGTTASFSPERGLSRAVLGRVSNTIDTNRTVAFEAAVRQNGDGWYGKGEYSQAFGQHWRATATAVALGGARDDFFGQYRDNAQLKLTARFSF